MTQLKRNTGNVFFPSIMEEFFRPDWMGGNALSVPPVNIRETDTQFEVELSAPGKTKDDFNIDVDQNLLTISSESNQESSSNEGKYTRREFSFSSFKRSFTLPETVNEDQITARYENGILSIVLPKKEEALPKAKRMIQIG
ncbi:MAG TPA: Hsp20/alpha crystallin family protein [Flavobacterium sp.]|nr:Hsp20/alpha crystallin family protein [Flavobacterium sp.]